MIFVNFVAAAVGACSAATITNVATSTLPSPPVDEIRTASAWGIIRVLPMRRKLSAYLSEFAGTAITLVTGVSAVAFMRVAGRA